MLICLSPRTLNHPNPLHNVYVYKVYKFTKGSGGGGKGGELNQREGERATGESTDDTAGLKIPI